MDQIITRESTNSEKEIPPGCYRKITSAGTLEQQESLIPKYKVYTLPYILG